MTDSRDQFEEWYERRMGDLTGIYERNPPIYQLRSEDGGYGNRPYLDGCWTGWSARDSEVERLREALEALMEAECRGRLMPIGAAWDKARAALSSQAKEPGNA